MANEVRIKTNVTGNAKQEISSIRDAWQKFQREGSVGVKAGLTAAAATKGFDLLNAGISGAIGLMGDAADKASDLEQSTGAIESVFGTAADKIRAFAKTADQSAGLSQNAVNEMAAVIGAQLQGMGFSADEAARKTINLEKRAADMAATFGGSTADAIQAIAALMRGERDPIERYGVSLKAADVQARILSKGLDTSTVAAKKNAEAVAGMELLMEQTAKTEGQFAREAESSAGSRARANAELENSLARIGKNALPLVAGGAEAASEALGALNAAFDLLGGKLPEAEEDINALAGFLQFLGGGGASGANSGFAAAEEAAARMAEKVPEHIEAMADASKDDLRVVADDAAIMGSALLRTGVSAEDAAKMVDAAMADIVGSVDKAQSDLEAAASGAADALYDPMIDKAKLAELERTAAELRAERNAADAHSRERADAQAKLTQIDKETMETLGRLAAAGDTEAANRLRVMAAAAIASGKLSASQIADLNLLLLKINQVESAAKRLASLAFMANASKDDTALPGRAGGGPVLPGQSYMVGESGPEKLVMGPSGGWVVPNSGSSGGGMAAPVIHVTFQSLTPPSPADAERLRAELGPILAPLFQRA